MKSTCQAGALCSNFNRITELWECITDHIHCVIWDVLTHPCFNFSHRLAKLLLKLWDGSISTSQFLVGIISYARPTQYVGLAKLSWSKMPWEYAYGLDYDCGNSSVLAIELTQSHNKLSICPVMLAEFKLYLPDDSNNWQKGTGAILGCKILSQYMILPKVNNSSVSIFVRITNLIHKLFTVNISIDSIGNKLLKTLHENWTFNVELSWESY